MGLAKGKNFLNSLLIQVCNEKNYIISLYGYGFDY